MAAPLFELKLCEYVVRSVCLHFNIETHRKRITWLVFLKYVQQTDPEVFAPQASL